MARKLIAVLGGGITGLTAAHRLVAMGHEVRLFEQSGRLGGSIRTQREGGWLIEAGPNSIQEGAPEVPTLLRNLGLDGERIEADPAARNRYLVRDGRLVPAPRSPPGALFTPLLSPAGKIRAACELFMRPRTRPGDASLAEFIRDHFGAEVLDRIVQPVVSGIWAGDPEFLSTKTVFPKLWEAERTHGSVIRGMIAGAKAKAAGNEGKRLEGGRKIISFTDGLETLSRAIVARLPQGSVVLNTPIAGLERSPDSKWRVLPQGGSSAGESFDCIVSALPASSLATLCIGDPAARPLAALGDIPHPPLSSLFLGFRRQDVPHPLDGFGFLCPSIEHRSILGAVFSSSLFPGCAPEGHVALTVMAGGATQPDMARLTTADLLAAVRPDLRDLLGNTAEPVFVRHTFWPHSIPQYNLGYDRHLDAIAACEASHPGLYIGGQVRDGTSLGACIASGERLAAAIG